MALKLEIVLNDNGSITVNGPIQNKLVCWGLLHAAADVIKDFNPQDKPLIEVPTFTPPQNLRVADEDR